MSSPGSEQQQALVFGAVDEARDELIRISLDIHAHPELAYEEFHAAEVLADSLERHGFTVERGAGGVDTAFVGRKVGRTGDGPTVAILAEYDALPGIGHGCGHNLIAMGALGAGIGASSTLSSLSGTLIVVGTPAEEAGGGKVRLLEAGVLEGVDVALSLHPGSHRTIISTEAQEGERRGLARVGYRYAFHGKPAHASSVPEQGINALNAVIHLFTAIDALRQHLRSDVRIHGVITHGGEAPNIVPDFAAAEFYLRARDENYLREVVAKVQGIAEGAALMTGARAEIEEIDPLYESVQPNPALARATKANAELAGLAVDEPPSLPQMGGVASTDFGNVSQRMPSFALSYAITTAPVPGHSRDKAEAAATELALENTLKVAKALGLTASQLLSDPELLASARADFAYIGGQD